jgi:hypothetical protein
LSHFADEIFVFSNYQFESSWVPTEIVLCDDSANVGIDNANKFFFLLIEVNIKHKGVLLLVFWSEFFYFFQKV